MSSAILSVHEHSVPAGSMILRPKICLNCGRNCYVLAESRTPYCNPCHETLRTSENQLWECRSCGTMRNWGNGRPFETAEKLLKCLKCLDTKRHTFKQVVA